jgi:hypothetical protein
VKVQVLEDVQRFPPSLVGGLVATDRLVCVAKVGQYFCPLKNRLRANFAEHTEGLLAAFDGCPELPAKPVNEA